MPKDASNLACEEFQSRLPELLASGQTPTTILTSRLVSSVVNFCETLERLLRTRATSDLAPTCPTQMTGRGPHSLVVRLLRRFGWRDA